jgi:dihydrofolate synthase/folylpolyglutamate synthase
VRPIDLSLDRVREVHRRLGAALACPVITVTGTNGKGSTSAILESILRAAGYRTVLYTSPHLLRYNERVRIDGQEAGDVALCEAFAAVEAARGGVTLTYFEYGTLAALWLFARAAPDVAILEVGLGGRLDAVNVIDADVAVLTSVGIDHVDYLGPTREDIGREKAGIFRAGRPAICADPDPPASVADEAKRIGADLRLVDRDFGYVVEPGQWSWWSVRSRRAGLPHPALRGRFQLANAAAALAALEALAIRVPVPAGAVRAGLVDVQWSGRFQVFPGQPAVILDVAHNVHAAAALAETLAAMERNGLTWAVFGMLSDKDCAGVVAALRDQVDRWIPVGLPGPRGQSASALEAALRAAGVPPSAITPQADAATGYRAACGAAGRADRIVVFGSFLTVAAVLGERAAPGK